jgi:hypothetical protein
MITGGSGSSTTGVRPSSTTGPRPSTTGRASGSSTTGRVVVPPICQQDVGVAGLPTAGDMVTLSRSPFVVGTSGEFDVIVAYSATGDRVINVDVIDTKDDSIVYGTKHSLLVLLWNDVN